MLQKQFSLQLRTSPKGKKIYYVQFKLPNGKYGNAKSTGQKSKNKAESWAIQYLSQGQVVERNATFEEIAQNFFSYEGRWAQNKIISGISLSENWCKSKQMFVDIHLLPYFQSARLSDITKMQIDYLRNDLYQKKEYSGSTVNKILDCLSDILKYAEDESLIQRMPRIDKVSNKPKQARGALTVDEVLRLFWKTKWDCFTSYVCNLLAASTGLRQGEALGIQLKNIDGNFIHIDKGWDRHKNNFTTATKNGETRVVAVNDKLLDVVKILIEKNPYKNPESFLFYTLHSESRPLYYKIVVKHFYRALERIGIREEERKGRGICFHSHRHFANTLMIESGMPLAKVQQITGHSSDKMSIHYYHMMQENLDDFVKAQDRLFLS